MRTILITGFGPFPGAPYNPTRMLVQRIARVRWPNVNVVPHVFPTQYAAIDRELASLLAKYRPDGMLSFGLHGRARTLRVETLARNVLGVHRDAGGRFPRRRTIGPGASHKRMASPAARLSRAARKAGVPAVLSRDAGGYLCNYLCWRATEATQCGLKLAAFVHVPPLARKTLRHGNRILTALTLQRAGKAMLHELARCLGSAGMRA